MYTKEQIFDELQLFRTRTGGLGNWITEDTHPVVLDRIGQLDESPITKVQLNQLLAFGHEAPVSEDFFQYYWLKAPVNHPYDVKCVPHSDEKWLKSEAIMSMAHLKWGLYRIYIDSLLWFGNVRSGYRKLRPLNAQQLESYFSARRFDTELIAARGPALPPVTIARDDRYLIAEMACKSYGEMGTESDLRAALVEAFDVHQAGGGGAVKIRNLLQGEFRATKYRDRQPEFLFSADDVLER